MGRDKEGFNEKWIWNTQVFPKFICPLLLIIIYLNISLFLIGLNLPANSTKQLEPSDNLYMVTGMRIVQFGF